MKTASKSVQEVLFELLKPTLRYSPPALRLRLATQRSDFALYVTFAVISLLAPPMFLGLIFGDRTAGLGLPIDDGWVNLVLAEALMKTGRPEFNPGLLTPSLVSPAWIVLLGVFQSLGAQFSLSDMVVARVPGIILAWLVAILMYNLTSALTGKRLVAGLAAIVQVEKPVEIVVTRLIERPVENIVTRVVPLLIDKVATFVVEKPVERVVLRVVEKPVEIVVTRVVERPVVKIVTRLVDRPVEVVLTRVVERPVDDPSASAESEVEDEAGSEEGTPEPVASPAGVAT